MAKLRAWWRRLVGPAEYRWDGEHQCYRPVDEPRPRRSA